MIKHFLIKSNTGARFLILRQPYFLKPSLHKMAWNSCHDYALFAKTTNMKTLKSDQTIRRQLKSPVFVFMGSALFFSCSLVNH